MVLENTDVQSTKTKELSTKLNALGWRSVLVVEGEKVGSTFERASANLHMLDALPARGLNVYDVLRHDLIALTPPSLDLLLRRLTPRPRIPPAGTFSPVLSMPAPGTAGSANV